MIADLELTLATRIGVKYQDRSFKSERNFLDFSINGQSLWEKVGKDRDSVSIFCREFLLNESIRAANRLLLTEKADCPGNRRSLFICAECGDLGCGAITAVVKSDDGAIIWSDFGFENNYEHDIHLDNYRGVGPFVFDSASYSHALLGGIDWLKASRR
jgi:hypothetical protein